MELRCPDHPDVRYDRANRFLQHFVRRHSQDHDRFPLGVRPCPHCGESVALGTFSHHLLLHSNIRMAVLQRLGDEAVSEVASEEKDDGERPLNLEIVSTMTSEEKDDISEHSRNELHEVQDVLNDAELMEQDVESIDLPEVDHISYDSDYENASSSEDLEASEAMDEEELLYMGELTSASVSYSANCQTLCEILEEMTPQDREVLEFVGVEIMNRSTEKAYTDRLKSKIMSSIRERLPSTLKRGRHRVMLFPSFFVNRESVSFV